MYAYWTTININLILMAKNPSLVAIESDKIIICHEWDTYYMKVVQWINRAVYLAEINGLQWLCYIEGTQPKAACLLGKVIVDHWSRVHCMKISKVLINFLYTVLVSWIKLPNFFLHSILFFLSSTFICSKNFSK